MKAVGALAAFVIAAVLIFWCSEVEAYRPFDGTDAAVAETGEMEIELGPIEYLRAGAERTLLAPDLRINYGFISGWEASLEGKLSHGLTVGVPGTSLVESDALLKGVLREGSLQEKPGPSIATEFGVLLPGINDQHGTGAVLNSIVSQRWDWGTGHLNVQIELTRQQHADYFLDAIIEAPHDWPVRPVAEIFYESDVIASGDYWRGAAIAITNPDSAADRCAARVDAVGVLNDAVSIYFLDATLATAFVARWCAGSRSETGWRRVQNARR